MMVALYDCNLFWSEPVQAMHNLVDQVISGNDFTIEGRYRLLKFSIDLHQAGEIWPSQPLLEQPFPLFLVQSSNIITQLEHSYCQGTKHLLRFCEFFTRVPLACLGYIRRPKPADLLQLSTREYAFQSKHKIFYGLRSEEHTSELQSRPQLVCRLL